MQATMTQPRRYLVRMVLFLGAVAAAIGVLFPALRDAFLANPALNGLILGVLVIGIAFNMRQVLILKPEIGWLTGFQRGQPPSSHAQPRLLAPMSRMLGEMSDDGKLRLSPLASRSLLDGIYARLEEARDIARYLIGLSVFLGLLGTFWGLLETVGAIGDVIGGLSVTSEDFTAVFAELKAGLEAPMQGMGTAFSSSLFGLGGSLVLGFLELQASQAQNQFFNDLEEWLSGHTKASGGLSVSGSGDGLEAPVPAYIEALLEQTADSLSELQRILTRESEQRQAGSDRLNTLTSNLSTLSEQMRAEQHLLLKMAEAQAELKPLIQRLGEAAASGGFGIDETTRGHIRSLDTALTHMAREAPADRDKLLSELRSEIRLLARTIAAGGGGTGR